MWKIFCIISVLLDMKPKDTGDSHAFDYTGISFLFSKDFNSASLRPSDFRIEGGNFSHRKEYGSLWY